MDLLKGRTHEGPAGSAVEVMIVGELERPDWSATVSLWFITAPGQSPAWDKYLLSVVHLRDVPDVPPAKVNVPGATHEVMLRALDPTKHPTPLNADTWKHLIPINFVEQVQLPDDAAAKELVELAAVAVVRGVLWAEAPLAGQTEPWRTSILKTAAHLRGEEHAS